jgi:integrase
MPQAENRYSDLTKIYANKIDGEETILPSNKAELKRYFETGFAGKSEATKSKNAQVLFVFARQVKKPLKELKRSDIEPFVSGIMNSNRLTDWSKLKYLSCIVRFFRILHTCKRGAPPSVVSWIEFTKPKRTNGINAGLLLTPGDIRKMLQATKSSRDRFLISLLYDCGCRSISEMETLNFGNIADKGDHLEVSFQHSKTIARTLPVANALPYFRDWAETLKQHGAPKAEQPLFVEFGSRGNGNTAWQKRLSYETMRKVVIKAAKKARLSKPINLHWFRKSTASLYSNHFSNTVLLDQWFGWSGGIHDQYIGLSTKKLLEQYLLFYNSADNELRPLQCKCGKINCGHLEFCDKCQAQLYKKVALASDLEKHKHNLELLTAIKSQGKTDGKIVELIASLLEQVGTSEIMLENEQTAEGGGL